MSRRRTMAIVRLTTIAVLGQAAAAAPALAQEQLPPLDDRSLAPGHDGLGQPAMAHEALNLACGAAQTTVTVTYSDKSGVLPSAQALLAGPGGAQVEVDLPRIGGSRVVSKHQGAVTLPAAGRWTLTTTATDEQGKAEPHLHYSTLEVLDDPELACPPTAARFVTTRDQATVSWTNPPASTAVTYRVEDGRGGPSFDVPASSTSANVQTAVREYAKRQWRVVPIAADGTEGTPSAWSNPSRRWGSGLGPSRIGAFDRYSTAASLTTTYRYFGVYDPDWPGIPPTVGTVYVATGLAHADALGAGPAAAAAGGPVLLTPPAGLPEAVRSTIDRLNPERIVVVGGKQAVSDTVLGQLAPLSPRVERLAGTDRYGTAAAIALDEFRPEDGQSTPIVFVADGIGFADALSGEAVAAAMGAPLLLTAPGALPAATATALAALRPSKIVVLGGEAAVGRAVADQLAAHTAAPVQRVAGADRYDTSAKIAQEFVPSAETIYLATGASFADALAAVPVAGLHRAPLLLSRRECLPRPVQLEMSRLGPVQDPWIVGGTAALSEQMANGLVCS